MKEIIVEFDMYLESIGLTFEAVIIGGAALNILDISSRKTKDVDCLDPQIPREIKEASKQFSIERKKFLLDADWLNNGSVSLKSDLPSGWRLRTRVLYHGKALHLDVLGRSDLLKSKLFAYCDRVTPDFEDLILLKPLSSELYEAIDWVKDRDAHPNWSKHVEKAFFFLRKTLGYE